MTNGPKEADFALKEEGLITSDHEKAKAYGSSQWLRLKDPRIVRVSRAFGGKDRHSKVFTIRGLRDRRVRLSIPTAIYLYDLQHKLGLNQPSKVFDWLLNAAKQEIDELPPLPIPQGNFTLGNPSLGNSKEVITSRNNTRQPSAPDSHQIHIRENREQESGNCVGLNVLPLVNTMPLCGYQWESSSDVAHLGNHGFVPFPSTLSLSTRNSSSQGPTTTTQSYFPPSHVAAMEMDLRQINHFQMLNSTSHQNHLMNNDDSLNPKLFHLSNSSESQSHKYQDYPSQ